MFDLLILLPLLGIILVLLFSANNSSIFVGSLAASAILSYKRALLLTVSGLILGSIFEGHKMFKFEIFLLRARDLRMIACTRTGDLVMSILITSILLMVALTFIHLPMSLTNVAAGAAIGAAVSCNLAVNLSYLWFVFSAWMVAPLLSAALTFLIYRIVRSLVARMSLASLDAFNRTAVTIVVFAMAYSLGANNIGFINTLSGVPSDAYLYILSVFVAILCGAVVFGRGVSRTMGPDLVILSPIGVLTSMFSSAALLWGFTQFGLPMSATQMVLGGIVGAGLSRSVFFLNRRLFFEIVGSWPVVTLLSIGASYLVAARLSPIST